jgi:hypothetical protein
MHTQLGVNIKKIKLSRYTPWRCLGEGRYSSYSFTTSELYGGEWSTSRPGRALPPGKGPPVPIVQEAGWAPEPVWTQGLEEKSFRLCRVSNLDPPVVQSVAGLYTDWATRRKYSNSWFPPAIRQSSPDWWSKRHRKTTRKFADVMNHYVPGLQ